MIGEVFVLHNFQYQGTLKSAVQEDFLTDKKNLRGFHQAWI